VSSEEQVAGYSIEAQIEAIRRWAEAGGHQLRVILVEPGLSARSSDRPVFQQAIKMVLAGGQGDLLAVHKFDRFSRNVLDSRLYKQMLRSNGRDIISVTEPIDGGPAGQLMEGILELFAEYYIVNLGSANPNNNHSYIIYAALLPSPVIDEPVNRLDLQAFCVPEIVSETRF
jgi:DNA invertase Pin-like site-specific DNA recombinase